MACVTVFNQAARIWTKLAWAPFPLLFRVFRSLPSVFAKELKSSIVSILGKHNNVIHDDWHIIQSICSLLASVLLKDGEIDAHLSGKCWHRQTASPGGPVTFARHRVPSWHLCPDVRGRMASCVCRPPVTPFTDRHYTARLPPASYWLDRGSLFSSTNICSETQSAGVEPGYVCLCIWNTLFSLKVRFIHQNSLQTMNTTCNRSCFGERVPVYAFTQGSTRRSTFKWTA